MRTILPVVAGTLAIVACGGRDAAPADSASAAAQNAASSSVPAADSAAPGGAVTVSMLDSAGRDLGVLTVTEVPDGLRVTGTLQGLPPGSHGFHIHTSGQCEAPDFQSAGGHWNPTNREHGTENPNGPHLGDMANITVAADSTVAVDVTTPGGTLRGVNALLDADGAAIMVHDHADDYRTDPAGDAGGRIACGVVSAS